MKRETKTNQNINKQEKENLLVLGTPDGFPYITFGIPNDSKTGDRRYRKNRSYDYKDVK